MLKKQRRVVVTGLGVISSIGIGWKDFWKNLIAGKSGISRIESFDTSKYDRHYGGEVKNFRPEELIDKRKVKHMGRASQMAMAAARLAIEDAVLDFEKFNKENIGVCIGTTTGEARVLESLNKVWFTEGISKVDETFIGQYPSSVIPSNIALEFNLNGSNFMFPTACSAGNYAIGYSCDLIRSGKADIMLAGGVDAFTRITFTGFSRLYAMSPQICRPFDKNREGMLVGEGSGIVVLESLESALKRKSLPAGRQAKIYAEVLGYGLSCDAYHMTSPKAEGIVECMKRAIKESDINIDEVDYISAHGTGTVQNDKSECSAIKDVFNNRTKQIPISSIKSMLGHTMGAASAIEAITCCLAIKEGVVPPTTNYKTADSECDIDCVPNKARKKNVKIALNNSSAFGGNNACLVLKKNE